MQTKQLLLYMRLPSLEKEIRARIDRKGFVKISSRACIREERRFSRTLIIPATESMPLLSSSTAL
ncbi:MAG TPA: hypothetical protein PLM53_21010 [Spirochaetota bacterium]|nr:hypothetical protein [Spirochaetota bacterium]HPC40173.1 hypothetical protein [Spirochaetota bacterium]HPL17837.1 hypothetical protein [Spirochaetota bacterium]HQF08577.1 hypothetical protein [Spirochaetota bacterium]HQH99577.1 hypothetical protein [Spirochaetota bacterium]